jgi:thiol-disulfide isomerase/thioredoxin
MHYNFHILCNINMNVNLGKREVITSLEKLSDMSKLLQGNPGVIIMKLGAEWCGPCKRIESLVKQCMDQAPSNVQCAIIDVDESLEIYSFLKTKKVVNGIPAILGYYSGNLNYIPDEVVIGSDQNQVISFFQRCYKESEKRMV